MANIGFFRWKKTAPAALFLPHIDTATKSPAQSTARIDFILYNKQIFSLYLFFSFFSFFSSIAF
jgi:hypothetical protein